MNNNNVMVTSDDDEEDGVERHLVPTISVQQTWLENTMDALEDFIQEAVVVIIYIRARGCDVNADADHADADHADDHTAAAAAADDDDDDDEGRRVMKTWVFGQEGR